MLQTIIFDKTVAIKNREVVVAVTVLMVETVRVYLEANKPNVASLVEPVGENTTDVFLNHAKDSSIHEREDFEKDLDSEKTA